jgi:hypothetical protein
MRVLDVDEGGKKKSRIWTPYLGRKYPGISIHPSILKPGYLYTTTKTKAPNELTKQKP